MRDVDIVVGCFLMISLEDWNTLGGFDLKYFMYGEEADLCLRARALGVQPAITPNATIMHLVGASAPNDVRKETLLDQGQSVLGARPLVAPDPALWGLDVSGLCRRQGTARDAQG